MTQGEYRPHILLKGINKSFGRISAVSGITLNVNRGEFFSLLGPSGCGKTTILRLIAGLERPDSGEIVIDGRTVAGSVWVPPEKRVVGIVFQDYALFPHLTVFKNVAFGLGRYRTEEIKKRVMDMLELVSLAGKARRYPHELSGGEQQRVALARALAPSPEVLLLDEPFSSMDADLRYELRIETKRIQKETGLTTVLVTHDQQESFFLSERIGVLRNGRLLQAGRPDEIYHKPANRFVADFVERSDFISAEIDNGMVVTGIGIFRLNGGFNEGSKDVDMLIRPDDVEFTVTADGNVRVIDAQFLGSQIIYKLLLPDGTSIHSIRHSAERIPVGSWARVKVNPSHIVVFPKGGSNDD